MEAVYARNVRVGLINLMTLGGMGGLRTNTAVIGFKKDWYKADKHSVQQYEVMLTDILFYNYGLVLLRDDDRVFGMDFDNATPFERVIDKYAEVLKKRGPESTTPVPRPLAAAERPVIDVWG